MVLCDNELYFKEKIATRFIICYLHEKHVSHIYIYIQKSFDVGLWTIDYQKQLKIVAFFHYSKAPFISIFLEAYYD